MNALRLWPSGLATILAACVGLFPSTYADAQEGNEELAKKLANPVSTLISVPLRSTTTRVTARPNRFPDCKSNVATL